MVCTCTGGMWSQRQWPCICSGAAHEAPLLVCICMSAPPRQKPAKKTFCARKKLFAAPTVPTSLAAYACGFGVHMHVAPTVPTFRCAYACGSNGPNGFGVLMHVTPTALDAQARLVCICRAWLHMPEGDPRQKSSRPGCYAYAVRSCICPRVTLDPQMSVCVFLFYKAPWVGVYV